MDVKSVEEVPKVEAVLKALHEKGKGVIGMKVVGEGKFGASDEKKNGSIKYVLGLGSVNAMVVGFEKIEETDDFAARVKNVPVLKTARLQPADRAVAVA